MRVGELKPGDRVRFTGVFLKNTGQQTGEEGTKKWTVVPCDCELCVAGSHVAVDEYSVEEHIKIAMAGEPAARVEGE